MRRRGKGALSDLETVLLLLRATTSKQLPSGYQLYLSSAKPSYYTLPFSFLFINVSSAWVLTNFPKVLDGNFVLKTSNNEIFAVT